MSTSLKNGDELSQTERRGIGKGKHRLPKFDVEAALAGQQLLGNDRAPHGTASPHNSNTFLTEIDDEMRKMSFDEFLQQQQQQQALLHEQQEENKRFSKEFHAEQYRHLLERIAKMKSVWNKLDIVHRDKLRVLGEYENQVGQAPLLSSSFSFSFSFSSSFSFSFLTTAAFRIRFTSATSPMRS
jgi:hypothetical protein